MRRLAVIVLLASGLALVPQAAPHGLALKAPGGLHAFLLRADEPVTHSFPRTPSFAWTPVASHSGHYQFELATSRSFDDSTIVFKAYRVGIPAVAISRPLPWMTGDPYALWAHVRWISGDAKQATPWSVPFGLNMRWRDQDVAAPLPAPVGLVRWQPIEGATAYEVLYPDLTPAKSFLTTTNVADEREFFTFHSALGVGTIHWRVRAIRNVGVGNGTTNGLPAVTYGPWSPIFSTDNPALTPGTLAPVATVSDAWDKGKQAHAHQLTPGFAWTPSSPVITQGVDPGSSLYRVYIFTDRDCVNRVFTGSVVGSPAYAPRTSGGPMALPSTTTALTQAQASPPYLTGPGTEGTALDATGQTVVSNEYAGSQVGATGALAPSSGAAAAAAGGAAGSKASSVAGIDLWDSGWPSGRYYWTVVPVSAVPSIDPSAAAGGSAAGGSSAGGSAAGGAAASSSSAGSSLTYHDMVVPQDSCQAGLGMSFGKVSQPVVTAAGKAFLSGLSPTSNRFVASAGSDTAVHDLPLAAWEPAMGATKYQIEISNRLYPWHVAKRTVTSSTSVVLPLTTTDVGTWYYRVRGVNDALPVGAKKMSWSKVVKVTVTGDRFTIVGG